MFHKFVNVSKGVPYLRGLEVSRNTQSPDGLLEEADGCAAAAGKGFNFLLGKQNKTNRDGGG